MFCVTRSNNTIFWREAVWSISSQGIFGQYGRLVFEFEFWVFETLTLHGSVMHKNINRYEN